MAQASLAEWRGMRLLWDKMYVLNEGSHEGLFYDADIPEEVAIVQFRHGVCNPYS